MGRKEEAAGALKRAGLLKPSAASE
jgi:hypothetical protein